MNSIDNAQQKDRETAGSVRSFNDVLGLNLIHHQDDEAIFELTVSPEHCNLHGSVHGGVILSILDVCGIWAGATPGGGTPQSVTTSVNCSFLRSAGKDDRRVRATGTVSKRGKAILLHVDGGAGRAQRQRDRNRSGRLQHPAAAIAATCCSLK